MQILQDETDRAREKRLLREKGEETQIVCELKKKKKLFLFSEGHYCNPQTFCRVLRKSLFLISSELEKKREAKKREREAREKEARKREKAEEKEKRRKEYNAQVAAAAVVVQEQKQQQQQKKTEERKSKKKNGQASGNACALQQFYYCYYFLGVIIRQFLEDDFLGFKKK